MQLRFVRPEVRPRVRPHLLARPFVQYGMQHAKASVGKNADKQDGGKGQTPFVIYFGKRAITDQNFSKTLALPKGALANCGSNVRKVNVELVQDGSEKYLRLKPVLEEA